MSSTEKISEPHITPELIAEASAWLAILHGPDRTSATERGFTRWMKRSAQHARAFEEATGIWEEARSLPRPPRLREVHRTRRVSRLLLRPAFAAAALAAIAIAAVWQMQHSGVSTGVGEQRVLALDDGTRVILNTDSRVVVDYSRRARSIELKEGEALFEVARHSDWPFFVTAGDRRIQALGTSFAVRRDAHQIAVTLVEGKVTVASLATGSSGASPVVMAPGERVVFTPFSPAKADRPPMDKLLAWQRREVALDNVVLSDAVAEMNRYSRKRLVADAGDVSAIRVTGLFRAGDSLSFARAVAEAYQLDVVEEKEEIRLVHR
jgi:transmembrane sensor